MKGNYLHNYPYSFLFLYGLIYMSYAILGIFLPVYLEEIGFSRSAIGLMISLGPFVAIFAQPFWGTIGDRAGSKNNVLKIIIAGTAIMVLFFRVSTNYYFLLFIMTLFAFFQTPINPVSDTIALEYLDDKPWSFSPVRLSGTIGYAIMALIVGRFADYDINLIFTLFFVVAILILITSYRIPVIKGHQTEQNKISFWALLQNRELIVFLLFALIVHISLAYYMTFYSIYFIEIGGSSSKLGLAMFLSAASEIPFLLFADRILARLGTKKAIIIAALAGATRWFLIFIVDTPTGVLLTQALHGFHFIVLYLAMVNYINKNVMPELKTSGQGLYSLIYAGAARIFGGILGGVLTDIYGIRRLFLYNALLSLFAIAVFSGYLYFKKAEEKMADS